MTSNENMKAIKEKSREEYVIRVGPILKDVLNKQKDNVNKVAYDCVKTSDYEAGEIIGKKILQNKLV